MKYFIKAKPPASQGLGLLPQSQGLGLLPPCRRKRPLVLGAFGQKHLQCERTAREKSVSNIGKHRSPEQEEAFCPHRSTSGCSV